MFAARLATHRPAATHSAPRQPKRFAVSDMVLKLKSVPSRASASVIPNDIASIRPVNHLARIAFCATTSDSEPAPNTKRPAHATGTDEDKATMPAPTTISVEKIRLAHRVPIRSVSIPPTNTERIAATL